MSTMRHGCRTMCWTIRKYLIRNMTGYIESFNGKFRDECLNEQWFESLSQARECIAHWRRDYNEVRPHSSLGRIPPARFAQQHRQRAGGAAGSEQKQNFD